MPSSGAAELGALVTDAMAAINLEASPVEGFEGVMTARVSGTVGTWSIFAEPLAEPRGVLVYSVLPWRVQDARRAAVAELLTRANYLLRFGDVEMDFSDGEVRARTSVRGGPEAPTLPVVAEVLMANVEVAELLFPAIKEVASGLCGPSDAVDGLLRRLAGGATGAAADGAGAQ
jgi:hypothetical protein